MPKNAMVPMKEEPVHARVFGRPPLPELDRAHELGPDASQSSLQGGYRLAGEPFNRARLCGASLANPISAVLSARSSAVR